MLTNSRALAVEAAVMNDRYQEQKLVLDETRDHLCEVLPSTCSILATSYATVAANDQSSHEQVPTIDMQTVNSSIQTFPLLGNTKARKKG